MKTKTNPLKYGKPLPRIVYKKFDTFMDNRETTHWANIGSAYIKIRDFIPNEKRFKLIGDNRKAFLAIFGKPTGYFHVYDRYYHVWCFPNGFDVMTCIVGKSDGGTAIDVPYKTTEAEVIAFAVWLSDLIQQYESKSNRNSKSTKSGKSKKTHGQKTKGAQARSSRSKR